MKKLLLPVSVAILFCTNAVNAQDLTGSIGASAFGIANDTASSLTLTMTNVVQSTSGSFVGAVPLNGYIVSPFRTYSGLSTSPTTESVNDFLHISFSAFGGGSGTTPQGRFDFDLLSLTENSYNSATGAATFTGTGTIADDTSAFQTTPADVTINFSSFNNYTLTVEAVPEPATLSLAIAGLSVVLALRRRKA